MASLPGDSTMADTPTGRTGSTLFPGPTSSCTTRVLRLAREGGTGGSSDRIATPRPGGSRRPAVAQDGRELAASTPAAASQNQTGPHRRLLRRRFHRTPVGCDGLSGLPRELEEEFLRMERR